MKSNYPACIRAVLKYEGGRVDDARDPGGKTNQGVTQRVYDAYRRARALYPMDVYKMDDAERDAIYKQQYWDAIGGDTLPAGMDLCVFDAAVNSGVARAKGWQAKARTIDAYCDARLAYMKSLKSLWPHFKNGWSRRVADVRARAKMMAVKR